jgi:hypothetical protein
MEHMGIIPTTFHNHNSELSQPAIIPKVSLRWSLSDTLFLHSFWHSLHVDPCPQCRAENVGRCRCRKWMKNSEVGGFGVLCWSVAVFFKSRVPHLVGNVKHQVLPPNFQLQTPGASASIRKKHFTVWHRKIQGQNTRNFLVYHHLHNSNGNFMDIPMGIHHDIPEFQPISRCRLQTCCQIATCPTSRLFILAWIQSWWRFFSWSVRIHKPRKMI